MKTIGEVIDAVQDGERPDYDELRLTVASLSGLLSFDLNALMDLAKAKKEGKKPILTYDPVHQAEEAFRRRKTAFGVTPLHYLGDSYNPDKEECQKWRRVAKGLLKKVTQ